MCIHVPSLFCVCCEGDKEERREDGDYDTIIPLTCPPAQRFTSVSSKKCMVLLTVGFTIKKDIVALVQKHTYVDH